MSISSNEKTYAVVSNPANKKLISKLETSGAKVIRFPQVLTEKISLDEKSNGLLRQSTNFDWLIFFDVFAVEYFLRALEETGIDFFELDAARVCAFGEAVADRLRFAHLHADVIPSFVEPDAVFTSLAGYIGADEIDGKSFLSIKRRAAQNEIIDKLSEKGAIVAELEIYGASLAESSEAARLKALIKGGAIDEFVFSSPEDLPALQLFLPSDSIPEILLEINISAADEVTFQSLTEHNLKPRFFRAK